MEQELLREHCQSYLLGALEGAELEQIQRLIGQGDPETLAALHEAREMVAQFALAAPVVEPPAALRTRVLGAISTEPQKVVPIARPRRAYREWAGWAVAAALLIGAVILQNNSSRLQSDLARLRDDYTRLQARQAEDAAEYRRVLSILGARGARTVRLASTAPEAPQLRAYWSDPDGLVLIGSNVPAPAPGRTMQLWVLPKSGNPISAGVFQPDEQGRVVLIASTATTVSASDGLAISDEPAGGSEQPTTNPGWVGKLSD